MAAIRESKPFPPEGEAVHVSVVSAVEKEGTVLIANSPLFRARDHLSISTVEIRIFIFPSIQHKVRRKLCSHDVC